MPDARDDSNADLLARLEAQVKGLERLRLHRDEHG